ncbi:MAG: Ig-like domain-containing protein [Sandaracinaceae bacterium]
MVGALAIAVAVWAVGCDGTEDPEDAGPVIEDGGTDSGSDAGTLDTDAPEVTSSRPRNGEDLVERTQALELRFSEAIDPASGAITAMGPGGAIPLEAAAPNADGDVLTVTPSDPWPGGAQIDVSVTGFVDLAGNTQEDGYALAFETNDDGAPEVTEATPGEGASDLPTDPLTVSLTFSEPMNPLLGTLGLEGGGQLGEAAWSSDREIRVEITGLAHAVTYRLVLTGFEDRSANALDPAPVLGDGVLDFTTVADTTAPTVTDSNPTSGQADVNVAGLRAIDVTFSEPMDTSVRTAPYEAGTAVGTLTGNWSPDGTSIRFDAGGRVLADAEHEVDLSAFADAAGNPLDGTVMLVEGALTFTTSSSDAVAPFVVFSTPSEGSTGVSTRLPAVEVLFSEAMDVTATDVSLDDGAAAVAITGTWNAAGTRLTLPLDGFAPANSYRIDLAAFQDVSGNPIDTSHPYLMDGALDFTTGQATGESCADPLDVTTATTDGAAMVWELVGGQFSEPDGAPSCSAVSNVDSGVIVYEKTSADVASGGAALRITATSPNAFNGVQLEVFRGVCDPDAVGGGLAAREVCLTQRPRWDQYLDLPAGTYYFWVSNENSEDFEGATLRIEEIPAVPEGESCSAPYTSASANHSAPATDTQRWVVPGSSSQSSNFGTATRGEGSMECVTDHGPDAVVQVTKARAGSILNVEIDPFPAESGSGVFNRAGTNVAVLDGCDSSSAATLACPGRIRDPESFQVAGDAGDYYVWLAANNTEVELLRTVVTVEEIDPAAGETCATAIPITPGMSNPITPTASTRYFTPSCAADDVGVTWYRYTTTAELNLVSLVGAAAPLALIDALDSSELACVDNGSGVGVPRRAPVGSEVCVAVPSNPSITAIAIAELPWQGVDGGSITDLEIGRPLTDTGSERSITNEEWLEITPTQIYMGVALNSTSAAGLVVAPRAGGAVADFAALDRYQLGRGGVAFGEAVFTIDETSVSSRPERLFRVVDPTGAFGATAWDTGTAYDDALDIDCLGRISGTTDFLAVSDNVSSAPTTFYRASSTAPGPMTVLGQSATLEAVVAVAAADPWIFVLATTDAEGRSVYRVPLADVTAPPELLVPPDLVSFSSTNGSIVYDGTRDILYFRSTRAPRGVHAVFAATTSSPVYAGLVAEIGGSSDFGLAIDESVPSLVLFETTSVSTGNFVEIR